MKSNSHHGVMIDRRKLVIRNSDVLGLTGAYTWVITQLSLHFSWSNVRIWGENYLSYANSAKSLSNVNYISYCSRFFFGDWGGVWWDECRSHFLPELLSRLKCSLSLDPLRWLDTVFQGQYLPSLSINYVTKSKVLEKLPPQLF